MLTAPILPGRAEAWRRMCQELLGSRAEGFTSTCRRLDVLSQRIWVVPTARGELVAILLDVVNPNAALADLACSEAPFDIWLLQQLRSLMGIDLTTIVETRGELVLEWIKEVR